MASLTVRNVPEDAKHRFRQVAAAHGRSMEEHLRQMVIEADSDISSVRTGVSDMNPRFQHFEPLKPSSSTKNRTRIEHLIALGRGLDFVPPKREIETLRDIDFS